MLRTEGGLLCDEKDIMLKEAHKWHLRYFLIESGPGRFDFSYISRVFTWGKYTKQGRRVGRKKRDGISFIYGVETWAKRGKKAKEESD